jgi:hypothetical protein
MNRLKAQKEPIGTLFMQPGGYTTIWVNTNQGLYVFEGGTTGNLNDYHIVTMDELTLHIKDILESEYITTGIKLSIINWQNALKLKEAFKEGDELYYEAITKLITYDVNAENK